MRHDQRQTEAFSYDRGAGMNAVVTFPNAAPAADLLIPELHVLALRPCLSHARLRAARKAHNITWTRGKRGSVWYRLADVDRYIHEVLECPARAMPSSKSADNGSAGPMGESISTVTGLTPELESHVANHLAQQI